MSKSTDMDLDLVDLGRNHYSHDNFVRSYLGQRHDGVVHQDLLARLVAMGEEKPSLVAFITNLVNNCPISTRRPVHLLALYIMLRQYPDQWVCLFDHTYMLLCSILNIIRKTNVDIYPPIWTEKVFRLESIISPKNLRGLIFGIDPISYRSDYASFATGHAFAFDVPTTTTGLGDPSSTEGLMKAYGLTRSVSLIRSITLETYFIQPYGIGMVNFIRTIKAGSYAGSKNIFIEAWSAYNLALLHGVPLVVNNVLIFQNELFIFDKYSDSDCFLQVKQLLTAAPRCSHPSYIRARDDHCLSNPNSFYNSSGVPEGRCNNSVCAFVNFLRTRNAEESFRCLCTACIAREIKEMLQNFLDMLLDDECFQSATS